MTKPAKLRRLTGRREAVKGENDAAGVQILRSTVTTLPMICACVPSMGE